MQRTQNTLLDTREAVFQVLEESIRYIGRMFPFHGVMKDFGSGNRVWTAGVDLDNPTIAPLACQPQILTVPITVHHTHHLPAIRMLHSRHGPAVITAPPLERQGCRFKRSKPRNRSACGHSAMPITHVSIIPFAVLGAIHCCVVDTYPCDCRARRKLGVSWII